MTALCTSKGRTSFRGGPASCRVGGKLMAGGGGVSIGLTHDKKFTMDLVRTAPTSLGAVGG